jgi:hypothetical protein
MRLNRPQAKNAINVEMLQSLAENYTRLSSSTELRCGVLCGEGDIFCAGLDLMDVIPRAISEGRAMYLKERQCDPFGLFGPPCSKPVIVAVHGRCYTAGLELTLAADLCVGAKACEPIDQLALALQHHLDPTENWRDDDDGTVARVGQRLACRDHVTAEAADRAPAVGGNLRGVARPASVGHGS